MLSNDFIGRRINMKNSNQSKSLPGKKISKNVIIPKLAQKKDN